MDLMLNKKTLKNHKNITRIVLPKYHVATWAMLNNSNPLFAYNMEKENILNMFKKRNELIKKNILFVRCFLSMGVLRFRIKSK